MGATYYSYAVIGVWFTKAELREPNSRTFHFHNEEHREAYEATVEKLGHNVKYCPVCGEKAFEAEEQTDLIGQWEEWIEDGEVRINKSPSIHVLNGTYYEHDKHFNVYVGLAVETELGEDRATQRLDPQKDADLVARVYAALADVLEPRLWDVAQDRFGLHAVRYCSY